MRLLEDGERWLQKTFGLTAAEAKKLVSHPKQKEILGKLEKWREENGLPEKSSPLSCGYLLKLMKESVQESAEDGEKPSDIVRSLIYGRRVSFAPEGADAMLNEQAPGDTAAGVPYEEPMEPIAPEDEEEDIELAPLTHNQIAYFLDSDQAVSEFEALTDAFDAAQIEYTVEDAESGETIITWPEDQNPQVDQTLAALGIETYSADQLEAALQSASDLIEAVASGVDPFRLVEDVHERCKSKKTKHPIIAASEMGEESEEEDDSSQEEE